MGGNIVIGSYHAEPISYKDRGHISRNIHIMLRMLNNRCDYKLFGRKEFALHDGLIYSGSTSFLMNPDITDDDLKKYKPEFGDVDIAVPDNIKSKLWSALNNREKIAAFSVIGTKSIGNQISAIMHYDENDCYHQFDFEYREFYEDNDSLYPTECVRWNNSASFTDAMIGVKGLFHKILAHSLVEKDEQRVLVNGREVQYKPWAISDRGMRLRHVPIYQGTALKYENGLPLYNELKIGESPFITSLEKIFQSLFEVEPTDEDMKNFWSFVGLCNLMNRYLTFEQKQSVIRSFLSKIYSKDQRRVPQSAKEPAIFYLQARFSKTFDTQYYEKVRQRFYAEMSHV